MNWALLGTLTVQVYIYYLAFPNDLQVSKIVVGFVVVTEILQTLGDSRDTIQLFGAGKDFTSLFRIPDDTYCVFGNPVACVGQMFFAWRIFIIARSLYVPAVIAVVTIFQLGAGIWTGVEIIRANEFSRIRRLTTEAWLSATSAADLIIVASMVFYLLKAKQPELKSKTKATLARIIKITVETGVLCALCAITILYLFVAFNGNNYHLGLCIWLSKVYSNSILAILNSRAKIGHNVVLMGHTHTTMTQMTDVVFHSSRGPTSAMQFSIDMQASDTSSDSNGETLQGKCALEMVV
ncbi:hypothetical protein B0H12DRAFT_1325863 [Mycena haematopus]|nr:hypothetical protein B0H12DRAFT_1325863 [Mycena haematopus]